MNTRVVLFGIVPLALITALTGSVLYGVWDDDAPDPPSDPPPKKLVRVQVVCPSQGGVERTVTRPGTVQAYQFAKLYAKVSGYLEDLKVDIGARVEANELLATIAAPELGADVRKAQSDLKKADAQVKVMTAHRAAAQAHLKQAEAKVGQAEADLESAQATLTLRRQEYQRFSSLAKQQAVEKELVDEKLEARRAAEASERSTAKAVVTAKASVTAATADVTRAEADLDDARAQVQVAEAVLSRAQIWQGYTKLRSPYTGVITQRGYHDGDYIQAGSASGQASVLTVARTDKVRVVVWIPDPDVPSVRVGARATLRLTALPGKTFTGAVARTADAEDPRTRTMRTEIDLPNPDGRLKQGMFGRLTIQLGESNHGLTIPSHCLFGPAKEGKRSVRVVRDGKAVQLSVLVGQDDGVRAEILAGLNPDDRVIDRHDAGLTDGAAVQVTENAAKERATR